MTRRARIACVVALVCLGSAVAGRGLVARHQAPPSPQPEQPLPRFRAGANLVRIDAYVSNDAGAVDNLAAADFEVFEDNARQQVESFEVIRPRGSVAHSARVEPNTVAESLTMAADPSTRIFVLLLDIAHVQLAGSYRAQKPIANLLEKVIGADDMVGLMTTAMAARDLTLTRRTRSIEQMLQDTWHWGERDRIGWSDERERELMGCYGEAARPIIAKRRARRVLDTLEDLIVRLEGLREERKFVFLLSEGWHFQRADPRLAQPMGGVPSGPKIGVGPGGQLTTNDPRSINSSSCDAERVQLAAEDHEQMFVRLLQRANRANVSFYPVDARGLVVLDDIHATLSTDAPRLFDQQSSLRTLADVTDGVAVLNTNNLDGALRRIAADIGTYYLLGYYSTNTKLDGRYRKVTVRIKRPGVQVRARPGYLAPSEADVAAAREADASVATRPALPPAIARALDRLAVTRATIPMHLEATAGAGQIWLTLELDPSAVKSAEWQRGGRAEIAILAKDTQAAPMTIEVTLPPGQRTIALTQPTSGSLPPGVYSVRVEATAAGTAIPLQALAEVTVLDGGALLAEKGIVTRRGPATGLQYHPTADARFRRTERLRLEVPRIAAGGVVTARVLGRDGKALPLTVALSERIDAQQARLVVADLTLAPLAQGDYILEVSLEAGGKAESATYGFRIVP